jgi:hypothetical protein
LEEEDPKHASKQMTQNDAECCMTGYLVWVR